MEKEWHRWTQARRELGNCFPFSYRNAPMADSFRITHGEEEEEIPDRKD